MILAEIRGTTYLHLNTVGKGNRTPSIFHYFDIWLLGYTIGSLVTSRVSLPAVIGIAALLVFASVLTLCL